MIPHPASTPAPCPAAPRPPYELGLFIIHRASLRTGPGATLCEPQALPGPQSWSLGEQPWQQGHKPPPSTTMEGWAQGPAPGTSPPILTQQQGCQGPPGSLAVLAGVLPSPGQGKAGPAWPRIGQLWELGSATGGGCRRIGSVQEPPRSATAKAWVETKNKFGEGRERDRKHRHEGPGEAQI